MLTNHIVSYTHYPVMFNEGKRIMPVNLTFNKLIVHFRTKKLGFTKEHCTAQYKRWRSGEGKQQGCHHQFLYHFAELVSYVT